MVDSFNTITEIEIPAPNLLSYETNYIRLSNKEVSTLKKAKELVTKEYTKFFLSCMYLLWNIISM